MTTNSSVRIIGPGRAGGALAIALARVGWTVVAPVQRGESLSAAASGVDLLVIATPDGVIVEVGGVDLEMQSLLLPLVHQLQEHHGNRIGFLAGGATGHPDPECVATESARQQRR